MVRRADTKDTDAVLTLMFEVGRMIRRAMLEKGTCPLPLSYVETLKFVEEKKTPTMRDIADYLRIAAPSATAIVEALANDGYLSRKEDAKDRRIVRLSLTKKGGRLLTTSARIRTRTLRSLVGSLNGKDRKEFIRILSKIVTK